MSVRISASYSAWTDQSDPAHFALHAEFATTSQAQEFAALFPKYCGLYHTTCSYRDGVKPVVGATATLLPTKDNVVNETGIKRYKKIMSVLDSHGIEVEWDATTFGNAYPTREAFEASLGQNPITGALPNRDQIPVGNPVDFR